MATNTYFDRAREERNNQSFFKMCHSVNVSSEDMRALPYDFARSFSDKELSCKMKIRTQWGSSWEVAISKNPRFYFMEKSGWEKFVKDNALGHSEFLTFTHKGNMCFTVNIFKQDGNEMLQPSQSRASLASSSSFKIEQEEDEKKGEEVVVSSSELCNCVPTKAAESNGRKLKFGKKLAEESQNSKKAEKLVCAERGSAGFTIIMKNSDFLEFLPIPRPVSKYYYMPKEKAMLKIHHPDGKRSWDVTYLWKQKSSNDFSGWRSLCKEYPLAVGHTCIFTLIKPNELLLVVSKD